MVKAWLACYGLLQERLNLMLHRSIIVVSMTGNLAAKTSLNKTAQALAQASPYPSSPPLKGPLKVLQAADEPIRKRGFGPCESVLAVHSIRRVYKCILFRDDACQQHESPAVSIRREIMRRRTVYAALAHYSAAVARGYRPRRAVADRLGLGFYCGPQVIKLVEDMDHGLNAVLEQASAHTRECPDKSVIGFAD
jgi:hypothetical protein